MRKIMVFLAGLLVFAGTGCINFQYQGTAFTPTGQVNIYEHVKDLPDKKYLVMGQGVASGRYDDFTREQIYLRLQEEAEKKGADAVLITAYQIVPTGVSENTLLNQDSVSLWSEGSVTNSGWNQLYDNFDQYYGQYKQKRNDPVPSSYTRIVRASFIKYDKNLPKGFDPAAFEKKWHRWSKKLEKLQQPASFKQPKPSKKDADVVNFRDMN
ncbi:MAG: hypothetical protein PHH77_00655 [Victivallaceae bacterium]|nr:hypothetical protein [Victivallaceae bacterium]